jgi:predicted ester cyclase
MSATAAPAKPVPAKESSSREYSSPDSTEENKNVVRRLIEQGFNLGNLRVLDEVLDPSFSEHQSIAPGIPPTRAALTAIIKTLRAGFPDIHLSIEEIDAVNDRVWMRIQATGTNNGPFMGNPPTRRSMTITVFDQVRLKHGRIAEHWGVPDHGALAVQLGW